jgi:predicted HTH transcriptional regulator
MTAMDEIWNEVESLLKATEGPKLDFKWDYDLCARTGKTAFAKDIAAMANTPGGAGYIIIGVSEVDIPKRDGVESIPSFYAMDQDQIQRLMVQAISEYIEPPVLIEYFETTHPDTGSRIGIVKILPSNQRPHLIGRAGEGVEKNDIWVRRGSETMRATRNEVLEMSGDYWKPKVEEEREILAKAYRDVDRDARDWFHIAGQVSRRLFHTLPKKKRVKVVRDIFKFFGKQEYFDQWFGEEPEMNGAADRT